MKKQRTSGDKRTIAERKADDRESVNSNINALGAEGAMKYSVNQLQSMPPPHVRRMAVLTVRAAVKKLRAEVNYATKLAAVHATGLQRLGIKVAIGLLVSTAASAQTTTVYTNVVDGRAYRETIVRVERAAQPAAPVPDSIRTTVVLPRNYRAPVGAGSYVPPRSASPWGETRVSRPTPVEQPWYVNGFYVGPSPTGNWMSTSIGRPIVDVNIVGRPPAPRQK